MPVTKWACGSCELLNDSSLPTCSRCAARRPKKPELFRTLAGGRCPGEDRRPPVLPPDGSEGDAFRSLPNRTQPKPFEGSETDE
jgi:hypothetical protein